MRRATKRIVEDTPKLTAAERRRFHEEWVERVTLPGLGGLTRDQRELARKLLLRKRDIKLAGDRPRSWDVDRKLELLTDYELLLAQKFKSAEAHELLRGVPPRRAETLPAPAKEESEEIMKKAKPGGLAFMLPY